MSPRYDAGEVRPDVEAAEALGVPHFGIPRRDLTRAEYAERREAFQKLTDRERELYIVTTGQMGVRRRHDASGKPPTDRRYLDAAVEPYWIAKVVDLGLARPGVMRKTLRLIAKRLADAATEEEIERSKATMTPPPLDDDALTLAFLERDAARWRARARRDELMAAEHHRAAHEAEEKLVAHMRRLGMTS